MTVSTPPIPADTPTIERLVERWARKYGDRITGYLRRPAQPARHADFPPELSAELREALERHGVFRAYASYGPAYRLTYESGERIVVSQPWNERFLHYPLPYLDEVRFTVRAAWVLTPRIPSDLPTPSAFRRLWAGCMKTSPSRDNCRRRARKSVRLKAHGASSTP